jgi:hypothetical protein
MERTFTDIVDSVHHAVTRTIDRGAHSDPGTLAVRIGGAAGLGTLGLVAGANGAPGACLVAVAAGVAVATDLPGRLARRHRHRA